VGDRSRGRFASPADFPFQDCSPYSHVHVRRECLGFVPRSRANGCRPVPNLSVTIRNFCVVVGRQCFGFRAAPVESSSSAWPPRADAGAPAAAIAERVVEGVRPADSCDGLQVEEPAPAPRDGPTDALTVSITFDPMEGGVPLKTARLNLRVPTWCAAGATVQV
jgi:hypothetical protein